MNKHERKAKVSREEKIAEAIKRMKMIGLPEEAIIALKDEGYVTVCFTGLDCMYKLDLSETKEVPELESKYNCLVYLAIYVETGLGKMVSYFYVSDYPEEWPDDYNDLKDGYAMTYTYNDTYPICSEFGSIAFKKQDSGSLWRIG